MITEEERQDRMMKAEDLSGLLSVPLRTILRLAKEGKIPAMKVGGRWRFEREVIERWMKDVSSYRGRGRVLVVDDEPGDRQALRRPLEIMSLAVVEAGSVAEAVERLKIERYDAIFLDMVFPKGEQGGAALLEWLGSEGVTTPVVVVTGHSDAQTLADVLRFGTFVVLAKPVMKAQLKEAVAMVLRWKDFKK